MENLQTWAISLGDATKLTLGTSGKNAEGNGRPRSAP
jgi:hypothetical protein